MPIASKKSELELSWLSDVRESSQPLTEHSPIWVRHGIVRAGPMVPFPERHPYCEFGTLTSGAGIEFVEREQAATFPAPPASAKQSSSPSSAEPSG